MSLILNIDTASERAHISIAKDGTVLQVMFSDSQKEHASFLQPAIDQLIKSMGLQLTDIDAFAVTAGPGSYTGLRVGLASVKGLCYALQKTLIMIGTLELLTASAISIQKNTKEVFLYCPMIDARRMEVFTAIYDFDLNKQLAPCAMILNTLSFKQELEDNKILFFGNGSDKWKVVCNNKNALFENVLILPEAMSKQSNILFLKKTFTELAYCEPLYVKEFQTVNN